MIEMLSDAPEDVEALMYRVLAFIMLASFLMWTFYVVHYYGTGTWATVVAFFVFICGPVAVLTDKAYTWYDESRSY